MKVGGGVGLGVCTHFGKVARARQAFQGRVRLSPCARGRTLCACPPPHCCRRASGGQENRWTNQLMG